ncbi:MAG TPA: hypothetical protein VIB79_17970 [Candidatus Binatia bacterium]
MRLGTSSHKNFGPRFITCARLLVAVIVAGLPMTISKTSYAADFDGSKPLMCATIEALDCVPGHDCTKGRASEMGAPPFMRIDFANKTIGGVKRTTQILSMDKTENQILFQGKELEFGWTLALNQESGDFSATLVNRDGAFVLFGSCTPL